MSQRYGIVSRPSSVKSKPLTFRKSCLKRSIKKWMEWWNRRLLFKVCDFFEDWVDLPNSHTGLKRYFSSPQAKKRFEKVVFWIFGLIFVGQKVNFWGGINIDEVFSDPPPTTFSGPKSPQNTTLSTCALSTEPKSHVAGARVLHGLTMSTAWYASFGKNNAILVAHNIEGK